ncbi:MAG: insulinase family protein [Lachnospiraceae bacterium]|nr:insulinase family protein [Lachnospiraceae bacterium]
MKAENLQAYSIIEQHHSADLKSEAYLLEHKKSGARILVLENDDENKVFYIGFRTPPKDSTGVAHILEHSVLCGSEAFPLKDPFVELAKGSLNTFLNAMTYPDKTVYPVASCNDQDFKNLMHVYMDAVFHPNIYREEKIFKQEGWHYETDEDDNIVINGVVYNEMKGAFSSPDDVLSRETFSSLYPDTTYGVESGGDPADIPKLRYEDFLDFHRRYYHPVNSYIYLYGNADMEERLRWLDENYLSAYERISVDSMPGMQKPFDEVKEIRREYPIPADDKGEKQTYLSYNATIGTVDDPELYIAFQMIDYALVTAEGTPLRKALLQAEIGTEIFSVYENGIRQPFFSIVAKNAEEADKERFVSVIRETLEQVVKEGFDENALMACVNGMEFRFREGDTGRYPKGLLYGLKALDSWLYDDKKPLIHLESLAIFAKLRERIGSSYYTELVKKYLLDNTHCTVLVLAPSAGLTAKRDAELAGSLQKYKDSLTAEGFERLKKDAEELKAYQAAEDDEEAKACLPLLKRSDLRRDILPIINEEIRLEPYPGLFHEVETNGILYLYLLFGLDGLPRALYPYLGLLLRVFAAMDTDNYSYEQLGYEIDKNTGNITMGTLAAYPVSKDPDYKTYVTINMSCLRSAIPVGTELINEVMLHTRLEDKARLKEIIAECRSRIAGSMMSSGHTVAASRAMSYISEFGLLKELSGGMDFFRFIEDAEEHFDEKADEIIAGLKKLIRFIFRSDNLLIDVTGTRAELDALRPHIAKMTEGLYDGEVEKEEVKLVPEKKNEGFTYPGQVQYVCRAGSYAKGGLEYTGALNVLRTILSYGYLWNEVRVKGGAYGCMTRFMAHGEGYFVSYRDPHLKNTVGIFEKVAQNIREFTASEKDMTRYIIGTLSDLDTPLSPRAKGTRSQQIWLEGESREHLQMYRDQVLDADQESIRALAEYVEAFISDGALCVVGNEEKLKAESGMFGTVLPLLTQR